MLKETIVFEAKHHIILLIPKILGTCVTLLIGAVMSTTSARTEAFEVLAVMVLFVFMAFLGTLINCIIAYLTTSIAFSVSTLIGKSGLINTKRMNAPLDKINNISVSSELMGKIFGYGDIVITTSSGKFSYKMIGNAKQFNDALLQQIEKYKQSTLPA